MHHMSTAPKLSALLSRNLPTDVESILWGTLYYTAGTVLIGLLLKFRL